MSATNKPGKKIIRTVSREEGKPGFGPRKAGESAAPLLYGRTHYLIMGAGILLIALGLLLMAGGSMPSPDIWDETLIYHPRRTVLAPIVILSGIALEIYAIFKR